MHQKPRTVIAVLTLGAALTAPVVATSTPAVAGWFDFLRGRPPASESLVVPAQSLEGDRFNRIESQLRTLTGQIEELQFQVQQLQEQLRLMQEDADFRFGELESGPVTAVQPQPAQPRQAALPAVQTTQSNAIVDSGSQQLTIPGDTGGGTQPLDLSALARSQLEAPQTGPAQPGTSQSVAALTTGNPAADYQRGYDMIVAGDFTTAEKVFRRFIEDYPSDPRAGEAQYWVGESYFARGKYREAADEFLAGFNAYPNGLRAPDTLLKLGLSLAGLGEREAACSTYAAVLKQYPSASNALRQRVATEQAVAGC